jgi:16S rRNA (guanine(527)-N(7))-methyltransferase GidB
MVPDTAVFEAELESVLPADLSHRARVVEACALHLRLVAEVNEYMNLTRISTPREAAIKHVLDSIMPWPRIQDARTILDIGSGAGFPGIPLALVFPDRQFILTESIRKKAAFLDRAVQALELPNVEIRAERTEDVLRGWRVDLAIARAVARTAKLLRILAPVKNKIGRLLLYKGPDADQELSEAAPELRRLRLKAGISLRYELPDSSGLRSIIEIQQG